MNIIAADIGNSSIKISTAPDQPLMRFKIGALDQLNTLAENPGPNRWVIVSTAPSKTQALLHWLSTQRPADNFSVITNDKIPIKSSVKHRSAVGTDRLVAAYAAINFNKSIPDENPPHENLSTVIVDAGTAVTIDYINKQGTFCGGLIFPGVSTSLRSLANETEALPDLSGHAVPSVTHDIRIGDDTQSAIEYGVAQSQAWAIFSIAKTMAEQNDALVFVTGGGADLLSTIAPTSWQFVPDLIHVGCRKIIGTQPQKYTS